MPAPTPLLQNAPERRHPSSTCDSLAKSVGAAHNRFAVAA